MVSISNEEIRKMVRENYAKVAQNASASCCDTSGGSCCDSSEGECGAPLYAPGDLEGLPGEAVTASAGCGSPTAIGTLSAGETVVDFGSGGGIDCFLAAREVGTTGRVIGIDMTPDMVALARKNAQTLGAENVEFHLAEIENTPLADGIADVIISNCVINLAPDKDAVFREAYRILKPGGRVFVSDMVLTRAITPEMASSMSGWVQCLSGAELKDVYLGRMKDAGFEAIKVISESAYAGKAEFEGKIASMNIMAYKPR